MWMAHTLVVEGDPIGVVQYESDRSKFIGRNRELRNQRPWIRISPLAIPWGCIGSHYDLRRRVGIGPGQAAKLSYMVVVADTREEVINLARNTEVQRL